MKQYVVDAFTSKVFSGNPAAVCVLERWLPDSVMQSIAIENNLSETAFTVFGGERWHLRWFTPGGEVEMCGHATLATSFVLMNYVDPNLKAVEFDTLSGVLRIRREGELYVMDFPTFPMKEIPVTKEMAAAVGVTPVAAYYGADLVLVLKNEYEVRSSVADQELIRSMDGVCLHVTAPGNSCDCVTRTFAPKCGVAEDPVCGRAHCHIVPLWAEKLGKKDLTAYQASRRGGYLYCTDAGERTIVRGEAVLFAVSDIYIE